jgi:hypothetical protein
MKLDVTKEIVWAATIEDKPGGMAEKLDALAGAGANLEFIIARRNVDKPGSGTLFITPLKGKKIKEAAEKAGFKQADSMHALRIFCADKLGRGAVISKALADAGINLRGFSGAALGKRAVFNLAFDSPEDAKKAKQILNKI